MATVDELKQAQAAANTRQAVLSQAAQTPSATTQPVTPVASPTAVAAPAAQSNPISGASTPQAQAINQMYDAQKQQKLTELESAYNQSMSAQQAAADKIPETYQQRANDLAVQFERNRRNFNEQAAANGINTGTGSQANLALQNNYGRDYGNIQTAQADAQTEAQRSMADLTTNYQSQVQAALATNDYNRAAALLDEYNNQYNRDMKQAQTLASYGDFSMYAQLYGPDQAARMEAAWKAENPLLAYNTGRLSAQDYYNMTGSYPPGWTPPAAAGGYGGGGGSGSGSGSGSTSGSMQSLGGDEFTPEQVRTIQEGLRAQGYDIAVDGIAGPQTEEAYKAALSAYRQSQINAVDAMWERGSKTQPGAKSSAKTSTPTKSTAKTVNPYEGYYTDPVTVANASGATAKKKK